MSSQDSNQAAGELRLAALALAMRRSVRGSRMFPSTHAAEIRELRRLSERLLVGMNEVLPDAVPTGEGWPAR